MSGATDTWSRRRAGVAAEAAAEKHAQERAEQAAVQAELAQKDDADILRELDLPDPDQLEQGDDFSVFMDAAIPTRLRNRALRQLWRSNPVLANVDSLVDYGEDFTAPSGLIEAVRTTYQVGRGLLAHVTDEQDKADGTNEPVNEAVDQGAETPADMPIAATEKVGEPEPPVRMAHRTDHTANLAEPAQERPAVKRRMRFEFASNDMMDME